MKKPRSSVKVIRSNKKIDQIILFGSRAMDRNDPVSDIDLAVKGEGLTLDDIISAKAGLEELSLPYKMDLVIYDRINDGDLRRQIDRAGIRLYQR